MGVPLTEINKFMELFRKVAQQLEKEEKNNTKADDPIENITKGMEQLSLNIEKLN